MLPVRRKMMNGSTSFFMIVVFMNMLHRKMNIPLFEKKIQNSFFANTNNNEILLKGDSSEPSPAKAMKSEN